MEREENYTLIGISYDWDGASREKDLGLFVSKPSYIIINLISKGFLTPEDISFVDILSNEKGFIVINKSNVLLFRLIMN
jgi:hypothetical protein